MRKLPTPSSASGASTRIHWGERRGCDSSMTTTCVGSATASKVSPRIMAGDR